MSTQFNKQKFEDKVYALVTAEVNEVFPTLVQTGGDILTFHRQLLQAIHFVIEETVVQNLHGIRLMTQAQQKETK
jgi:hypothetical protein